MSQLPEEFRRQMLGLIGPADYEHLEEALAKPSAVSFRPNRDKGLAALPSLERVPWSSLGYYLDERPSFTFDPLFHAGAYYVQEPSSMFLEQALRACEGEKKCVLDLCAAPGGKSTLLRSLLPDDCLLVCNEPVRTRAQILAENMQKWGHPSTVVASDYPQTYASLPDTFDVIAVDAPCSGEGMFRKDNPALSEWSPAVVVQCSERQRRIVSDVWPALREGGYLIYSTCTYNLEEDERNVAWFCETLGAEVVTIPTAGDWPIVGNLLPGASFPVYRFMPHKARGEGFFLALMRKTRAVTPSVRDAGKKKPGRMAVLPQETRRWIQAPGRWCSIDLPDGTFAVRDVLSERVGTLLSRLHVLSAGVPLAQSKGRQLTPHPALALSTQMSAEAFPRFELERAGALDYLRRLSLVLPSGTAVGNVVMTYRGLPLGFVRNVGAHANNLFPAAWRIRSTHTPDADCDFLMPLPSNCPA